jgi:NtrC-family two-component system response regulator AlgB
MEPFMSRAPYRVLISESDPALRRRLVDLAHAGAWEAESAEGHEGALALLKRRPFDLALIESGAGDGEGFLEPALLQQPELLVAILAAFAGLDQALHSLGIGAWDWLPKPFGDAQLRLLLAKAERLLRLKRENHRLRAGQDYFQGLSSPQSLAAQDFVTKVAPTDETVLLLGETGTGKSELALAIHARSRRADKPFVTVFCSALAESLLESELFGHTRGAFTGAEQLRRGKLEAAQGGTLFLDEVGELSLGAQARLLRFLNDKIVEPVGGNEAIQVDARVIAASNRPLKAMVAQGLFREDLYFRLNMLELSLAPLRERRDEIRPLAQRFLAAACARRQQKTWTVAKDAEEALRAYSWPGNLRELRHAIDRAVVLGGAPVLELQELPEAVQAALRPGAPSAPGTPVKGVRAMEKELIQAVLAQGKSQKEAAQALGISTVSLWRKRKRMGL